MDADLCLRCASLALRGAAPRGARSDGGGASGHRHRCLRHGRRGAPRRYWIPCAATGRAGPRDRSSAPSGPPGAACPDGRARPASCRSRVLAPAHDEGARGTVRGSAGSAPGAPVRGPSASPIDRDNASFDSPDRNTQTPQCLTIRTEVPMDTAIHRLDEYPYLEETDEDEVTDQASAPPSSEASGPWRIYSVGFQRPGQVELFHYDEGELPPGQFRVQTLYAGISAGTELTHFLGTNPYMNARWDDDLKLFMPDGHSDYPMMFTGYMQVGRVIASRTDAAQEGEVVAMTYGHKSGHTCDPLRETWIPWPDDVDPMLGIYGAQMGPICA